MTIETTPVDPSNSDQAQAWDGAEGSYWAAHPDRFDLSLAHYQPRFQTACAISPGDRVLDVGCGTGLTTRAAARAAAGGEVLGVDLSSQMIEVARALAVEEGVVNARFERTDAQVHPFGTAGFDSVISRTGAMFFGDPDVAFANLARSLRPGGRLTLLTWQPAVRNEWIGLFAQVLAGGLPPASPSGVPGPFSLSDQDKVSGLLERSGFTEVEFEGLTGPMVYGKNAEDAHAFVLGLLGWMLEGRTADDRDHAIEALREALQEHDGPDGVQLGSATWLITAIRS